MVDKRIGKLIAEAREKIPELSNLCLIEKVKKELNKNHLKDDREKLTVFFNNLTGYLEPHTLRRTTNIVGGTAVGKTSLSLASLRHYPPEDILILTGATKATLEDDIKNIKIISFTELNTKTDTGANKELVEILKQISEGGISVMKKDVSTGYRTTLLIKDNQKAITWTSTEIKKTEELENRGLCVSVLGHPTKTQAVNDKSCDDSGDLSKLFKELQKKESWITERIRKFRDKNRLVYCPFMSLIKGIFDNQDPRSQRDVKRFISFVYALAWFHQDEREIIKKNKKEIIVASPVDIIRAIEILQPFLNQSYRGFDARLNGVMEELKDGQKTRIIIQKNLGIGSTNTIKEYINLLLDKNLIEYVYENDSFGKSVLVRENNSPMIRSLSEAYQKPIICMSVKEIKKLLIDKLENYSDRLMTGHIQALLDLEPLNLEELKPIPKDHTKPISKLQRYTEEEVIDENV